MVKTSGYRQVSLKTALYQEAEDLVNTRKTYSSVAALVSEALRLRLEALKSVKEVC